MLCFTAVVFSLSKILMHLSCSVFRTCHTASTVCISVSLMHWCIGAGCIPVLPAGDDTNMSIFACLFPHFIVLSFNCICYRHHNNNDESNPSVATSVCRHENSNTAALHLMALSDNMVCLNSRQ